jgi:hypothetical protein
MKKFQISAVLLLFLAVVSCKKTSNSPSAAISNDEVANISAGSLSMSTDGLATNSNDIAISALTDGQGCGTSLADSTTKSGNVDNVSFNYFLKYIHTLTCNTNNQHDNIVYDLNFHGHFEGPNINSIDTGSSSFKIAGFTPQATAFVINGDYKRHGKFTLKIGDKASGTSFVDIMVANLTVDKTTKNITGGSATFAISVTVPKGTFNFNGPVTFNGDGTANITINGTTYSINLSTGVVTSH